MSKIQIYVIGHKETFVPECKYLIPLQVGAKNNARITGFSYDDEGDNISDLNSDYCELTGIYWAWKNSKADYVGIMHYRRILNFGKSLSKYRDDWKHYYHMTSLDRKCLEILGYYDGSIECVISDNDIVIPKRSDLRERRRSSYYSEFCNFFKKELDYTLNIVSEIYPDYINTINESKRIQFGYHCNISIMKRKIFDEYCTFLFTILNQVYDDIKSRVLKTEKKRLIGYLAEYLTGLFILHNQHYKIREVDGVVFRFTDGKKHSFTKIADEISRRLFRLIIPMNSKLELMIFKIIDKKNGWHI